MFEDLLAEIQKKLDEIRDKIADRIADSLKPIEDVVRGVVDAIRDIIEGFADSIVRIQQAILEKFDEMLEAVVSVFRHTIEDIITPFTQYLHRIYDAIDGMIDRIRQTLGDTMRLLIAFADEIASKIEGFAAAVVDRIRDIITTVREKIETLTERVATAITEAYQAATEKIKTVLNELIRRLTEIVERIQDVLMKVGDVLFDRLIPFVKAVWDESSEGAKVRWSAMQDVYHGLQAGDEARLTAGLKGLTELGRPHDLISSVITLITISSLLPNVFSSIALPAMVLLQQQALVKLPVNLPPPDSLVVGALRKAITGGDYEGEMRRHGLDEQHARLMLEVARPLPSPGAIQEGFIRGFISESEHDRMLSRHGYTDSDIRLFKSLYYVIPPLPDIIRMSVREAFTPEIAEVFGQYQDFPEVFADWAQKQGLSRDWAKRYWAAHWDLPSVSMGYEMFHRRIITGDELKLLMRALDIMPFWRDKLIEMSYAPYTRVDIRRMYTLGILTEGDVYNCYLDLGYNPERARNLTEFTVRYYTPEEETELDKYRQLTREIYVKAFKRNLITSLQLKDYLQGIGYRAEDSEFIVRLAEAELMIVEQREDTIPMRSKITSLITDAYKRGLYNETEVRETLSDLGYTEREIGWYIALSDYEKATDIKKLILEATHTKYVERTVTRGEAAGELGVLFPYAKEMENLFDVWDIEREIRVRKPTEAQLRAALGRGLITIEQYAEELRGLGYAERYVELLSKLAGK